MKKGDDAICKSILLCQPVFDDYFNDNLKLVQEHNSLILDVWRMEYEFDFVERCFAELYIPIDDEISEKRMDIQTPKGFHSIMKNFSPHSIRDLAELMHLAASNGAEIFYRRWDNISFRIRIEFP